jgi:hypothetical protein
MFYLSTSYSFISKLNGEVKIKSRCMKEGGEKRRITISGMRFKPRSSEWA